MINRQLHRKIYNLSAVDVLAQHPKWQQQAETANKYLPVIIGSIQLGIEIKKMVDAKKSL